ncbi:MAG: TRIC cation channel family protein [Schaedlerella sp.]|nr:TRIC cation channel family protein [Schaedlerella sp.]
MLENFDLVLTMELIGTVAFAVSGAMVAIKKNLDILGILVLGVSTACGGGVIRDLLIGVHPPVMFKQPIYVTIAAVSVVILFLIVRFHSSTIELLESERYQNIMNFLDAIGLGIFTVVGVNSVIEGHLGRYFILMIFLGVITGVGGGVLRDVLIHETPAVLYKHTYACASIVGALCYVQLYNSINKLAAMVMSTLIVIILRLLARKYKWNLPKAH